MREITDHAIGGLNEALIITARDEPGDGGASHEYHVAFETGEGRAAAVLIQFQKGPLKEYSINGISNEALLAIVIDRLRGFQSGEFKCRENACALTKIEEALMWLQLRTVHRLKRGVEGTHEK